MIALDSCPRLQRGGVPPLGSAARLALIVAGFLVNACGRQDASGDPASRGEIAVSVRSGSISAPDTVDPGWTYLHVEEDGDGHIVVLYRMTGGAEVPALGAFAASLDGAATPAGAIALGGPEVGTSGEVIIQLTPGRYVLGCVMRGKDGHRHASVGEARLLVVRNERPGGRRATAPLDAPHATQDVPMTDFAYVGQDRWSAGRHLLAVRNTGAQDHQLRLARLREGATVREWMGADDPRQVATDVAGVARLGAGQSAYLPIELPAGAYVAYCLVPDPGSGRPHVMLGMFRAIHVAATTETTR